MGIVLGIIAVIAILYVYNKLNKKIDADEEKARTTPGVAQYIRNNFSEIVSCVSSAPGIEKEFESKDLIRFNDSSTGQKVILQQWSGNLQVGVIKNNHIIKEWNISTKDPSSLLLSEIKGFVGSKSYWESYKEKSPQKAAAILEITRLDMSKMTDKAAQEIVESIERWSRNTGKPISDLKRNFIESAIDTLGKDNLSLLMDRMKNSEMSKEASTYNIDKDHTITRFMIEALDDYFKEEQERKIIEQFRNKIPGFDEDALRQTLKELNLAPDISNLNNKENRLMGLLDDCCDMLNDKFKALSQLGRCEAILFFSTFVMDYGKLQNNVDLDIFEDRFKHLLIDKVAFDFDAEDIFGFLNSRVDFFKREYLKMKSSSMYAPFALYNAIYANPGCENPEDMNNKDTGQWEVMPFGLYILSIINYILTTKDNI